MNSNNLEKELNKYAKSWIRKIEMKQQVISTKHGKFLKVNNGDSVNTHITSILPKKKEHTDDCLIYQPTSSTFTCACGANSANQMRDDCAAAIERANLVVCPSLEELRLFISSEYYPRDERATLLSKALLALLHRTAPDGVSNSATQEKI